LGWDGFVSSERREISVDEVFVGVQNLLAKTNEKPVIAEGWPRRRRG
jgi:hypothetical protein